MIKRKRKAAPAGPVLESLVGGVIALIPAYFFMESIFAAQPHVAHWVGTSAGVGAGYGLGALVAAYKEQRFPFAPSQRTNITPSRRQRDRRR